LQGTGWLQKLTTEVSAEDFAVAKSHETEASLFCRAKHDSLKAMRGRLTPPITNAA
jgi:hypothetical protein